MEDAGTQVVLQGVIDNFFADRKAEDAERKRQKKGGRPQEKAKQGRRKKGEQRGLACE